MTMHPFIFCAHITKQISTATTTNGARGGIYWAASEDEARGALARGYLDDGFTVQILEVQPLGGDGLARIADHHAAINGPGDRKMLADLLSAVKPFLEAAAGTSDWWDDKRRMASLSYGELKVGDLRALATAAAAALTAPSQAEAKGE